MSKDLKFNILVKENFDRALSVGARALRGFGRVAGGIARRVRRTFSRMFNFRTLLAGGGMLAGLTLLAKKYGEQEAVDRRLADAFGKTGRAADKVIEKWGKFATSIQRVTTLGDEEIMMMIALAKNMGVADDKMEEATRGAIGLSKAFGLDMNMAMRGVALAFQGEFTLLNRYIPALRSAETEAEKMAVLQKAMASGFNQAKGELGTLNGMWASFKGVIGDALQAAGKGLFGGGGLIDGIDKLKQRVIELTESGAIQEWAQNAAKQAKVLGDVLGDIFSGDEAERAKALGQMKDVVKAMFTDAGNAFLNVVEPAMLALWDELVNKLPSGKDAAKFLMDPLGGSRRGAVRAIRGFFGGEDDDSPSEGGPRDTSNTARALEAMEDSRKSTDELTYNVDDLVNTLEGFGNQLGIWMKDPNLLKDKAIDAAGLRGFFPTGKPAAADEDAESSAMNQLSLSEVFDRIQGIGGEDLQKKQVEHLAAIRHSLEPAGEV